MTENVKYSVLGIWGGALVAMLFASGWVAVIGHAVFWLMLVAHAVEFVVNRSVFERAGGTMGYHFVQTMIYGLFHWMPIKQRLASPAGGEES